MPSCASEITSFTPRKPRRASLRRNAVQKVSASEGPISMPSTSRRPSLFTPTATMMTTDTIRIIPTEPTVVRMWGRIRSTNVARGSSFQTNTHRTGVNAWVGFRLLCAPRCFSKSAEPPFAKNDLVSIACESRTKSPQSGGLETNGRRERISGRGRLVAVRRFVRDPRGYWRFQRGKIQLRTLVAEELAEREGFEPSIRFPVYTLSKRAPSATRPPLRICAMRAALMAAAGRFCKLRFISLHLYVLFTDIDLYWN